MWSIERLRRIRSDLLAGRISATQLAAWVEPLIRDVTYDKPTNDAAILVANEMELIIYGQVEPTRTQMLTDLIDRAIAFVTKTIADDPRRLAHLGTCSICGTGSVGVRVSASGMCVVAMCNECDAVWSDQQLRDEPQFPRAPDLPCPGDGSSLREPPAHWASLPEAKALGWGGAIVDVGE